MHAEQLAFVSLGSNLGDARGQVLRALDGLQLLSSEPLLRSSLWRTAPVDCPRGSPTFINAIAGLAPEPGETPESLLAKLQDLEKHFGRRRKAVLNEPRPLDLDLITFGPELRGSPDLILPHPRAHLRRFVLEPLAELAPDFVLPGHKSTVSQMLAQIPAEGTMRLPV